MQLPFYGIYFIYMESHFSPKMSETIYHLSSEEYRALFYCTARWKGRRLRAKHLLVEAQPGDSNSQLPPLFFIGPETSLCKHLGLEQPVYILPGGVIPQNPDTYIKALATYYLSEIQTVQPSGPCILCGYCFGGLVAFEIAQQLQKQGKKVLLLALVNTGAPHPIYTHYRQNTLDGKNNPQTDVFDPLRRASLSYIGQTYSGRVTLFFSEILLTPQHFFYASKGWDELLTGEVDVQRISGEHSNVLTEPHVQVLAKNLRDCIDQVLCQTRGVHFKVNLIKQELEEKVCINQSNFQFEQVEYEAPRSALEFQISKIWVKVLGIDPIGIRDDFFKLGGHSLLAVRLLAEIEKQLTINLSLATLFQVRTIEEQANLIRHQGWSTYWQLLVLIKQGSSKPPLFCIHAVGPSILNYQNLTPYLDLDQPVYGLQAQGLNGKQAPLTRIEDMASQYIKEIQTVQPEGPYYLLGHSFGGLVAFEMAQQLHAQGQKIALLALLDTFSPKMYRITPSSYHQFFIHRLNLSNLKSKEKVIYILERIQWNFEKMYKNIASKFNFWLKDKDYVQLPEEYQLIEEADRAALNNYVPQIYPNSITLFRSIVRPTKIFHDPELGWRDLVAGEIEINEVPGNHLTMILEPHVQVLGGKLKASIDKALVNYSYSQRMHEMNQEEIGDR